jgi:hypothetical protein
VKATFLAQAQAPGQAVKRRQKGGSKMSKHFQPLWQCDVRLHIAADDPTEAGLKVAELLRGLDWFFLNDLPQDHPPRELHLVGGSR